jgi:hypothetical protein
MLPTLAQQVSVFVQFLPHYGHWALSNPVQQTSLDIYSVFTHL